MIATRLALAAALLATPALAELAPGDVRIVDGELAQPLTDQPGDPEAGVKWYTDRGLGNCMTCHVNAALPDISFQGDVAPALDGAADRWSEAQLRAILVNAKEVFGEQTFMPAMYKDSGFIRVRDDKAGKPIMSAQMIEDVLAYLLTLKE